MEDLKTVQNKTESEMTILCKHMQEHEHKVEEMETGIEGLEKYGTDF